MGLHLTSYILDENKIWMLAPELSILCRMDQETHRLSYVTDLLGGAVGVKRQAYSQILKIGDCIYALPDQADDIAIYNIISKNVEHFEINWSREQKGTHAKTGRGFLHGKSIYIVGNWLPVIVKFDTETFEHQIFHINIKHNMWKKSCQIGSDIIIPSLQSTKVVVFHTDKNVYETKQISIDSKGIASIQYLDKKVLVLPTDYSGIYELDTKNYNVEKRYELKNVKGLELNDEDIPFMHLYDQNGSFWLLPWKANMIIKINKATGEINSTYQYNNIQKIKYFNTGLWDENHIFGYFAYGESLDLLDTRTGELKQYLNRYPDNIYIYWGEKFKNRSFSLLNERQINLQSFISLIPMMSNNIKRGNETNDWKTLF